MKRRKLKKFRQNLDLNQSQIAEKLNISKQHYSKIETGNANPSFDLLVRFMKEFKYDDDTLKLFYEEK